MLTLHTRIASADSVDGELVLPFELREKSRLRARLSSGEEVALFTARGSVLRGDDLLGGDDGQGVRIVRIVAAPEATYRIECGTPRELLRCAFHLGNRHAQVEAGGEGASGFLRIRKDTVLKDMLEGLGARVTEEQAPFEPEAGAYGGGHHHGGGHPLAPVPLRQRIHRPSDPSA